MQDRNTAKQPSVGADALLPDHHALLFSALAGSILSTCGEVAEAILPDAVKSYALERGGRMRNRPHTGETDPHRCNARSRRARRRQGLALPHGPSHKLLRTLLEEERH